MPGGHDYEITAMFIRDIDDRVIGMIVGRDHGFAGYPGPCGRVTYKIQKIGRTDLCLLFNPVLRSVICICEVLKFGQVKKIR